MKKICTIVAVCAVAVGLKAQGNFGLENWQSITGTESPTDWITFNSFKDFGLSDSASVLKAKPAYSGQFAAKIRPVMVDFGFQYWMQGTMFQQYASTARPKSFRFAYKYASTVSGDPAMATVYFYKGNTADTNGVVGQALVLMNTSSSYVYVNQDITWNSANTPDTATISFYTGPTDTASLLTIDDVSMSNFSAGTTDIRESSMQCYQTANGSIRIEGLESWMEQVTLFDGMGRKVFSQSAKAEMAMPGIPAGIYYFEITGRDSRVTGKIVLE